MKCECNINSTTDILLKEYRDFRETSQLLCNFLMSKLDGWQVYLLEHGINVFRMVFCFTEDRKKDTSFILTLDQLDNFDCTLNEIIIPTLVRIEEESCIDSCDC